MSISHWWYDPLKRKYVEVSETEAWDLEEQSGTIPGTTAPTEADKIKARGGHMIDGPNYDIPRNKFLLTDVGTRFQHLADFQDHLAEGLDVVTTTLKKYPNDNDAARKKNLEMCLKFLAIYQQQLAQMEQSKWDLNNLLDKCVPERGVLEGVRRERLGKLITGETKTLPLARPLEDDENLQGA